jgi:WD40 repeat protein
LINIDSPANPTVLGECIQAVESECNSLTWSPDSRALLWNDSRGIWISKPPDKPSQPIYDNQVTIIDPAGQSSQLQAHFSGLQWSPLGRFALLDVFPKNSNVSWYAVLDTRTGRLQHLIDSYETSPEQTSVEWLKDGTLALAHAADSFSGKKPVIQIWNVVPTNPNLLVALQQYELFPDLGPMVDIETSQRATQKLCLDWLYQQQEGYLQFGAILEGNFNRPALFGLKMSNGSITVLTQLDPDTKQVFWSPDGTGLLVIGINGQVLYNSVNGGEVYDLNQTLGADPHDFQWLPPTPRG